MNIFVIIPVVNSDLCDILMQSILYNTVLPKTIYIIDNSLQNYKFRTNICEVIILKQEKRLGVNQSWNIGKSYTIRADATCILNDDIILNKHFFERVIKTFERYSDCAVACPNTLNNILEWHNTGSLCLDFDHYQIMHKREGFAFTILNSIFMKIPLIPSELTTFYGDDWIWDHVHKQGKIWYKDMNNMIFHKVGASIRKLGMRKGLRAEKHKYAAIQLFHNDDTGVKREELW